MEHDARVLLQPTKNVRPSEVTTFDFCPTAWSLDRQGWVPKLATRKLIAALWSIAFHAGAAKYFALFLAGDTDATHRATGASQVASAEWEAEVNHYLSYGVNFGTLDLEERRTDLVKLVQRWAKECLLLAPGWRVLSVEQAFQEDGNCRTDVMAEEPGGQIVVVDYKLKHTVSPKWFDMQAWVDEFAYGYKPLRYLHEATAFYKRPVRRHYIYGITYQPFDQVLSPYTIPDYYMDLWLADHLNWAKDIAEAEELVAEGYSPAMNATHKSAYGMCEFLNACTLHNREQGAMLLDYVKVPKRKHDAT